jgi:hypothetical protein
MRREASRLTCTFGDGFAEEASVGRIDFISLICLVSSVLLLTGMALALPGKPIESTSICRSRVDEIAPKTTAVPVTPVVARIKTRPEPRPRALRRRRSQPCVRARAHQLYLNSTPR